jgi:myo-inositol-1(or 4)-monophosphatase
MSTGKSVDLDEIYAFALQLGKDAGRILDDGWRARCDGKVQVSQEKDSAVDIVTQTDEGELCIW